LLIEAFAREVIDGVPVASLRDALRGTLEIRLANPGT
jgi:hypothetical protein